MDNQILAVVVVVVVIVEEDERRRRLVMASCAICDVGMDMADESTLGHLDPFESDHLDLRKAEISLDSNKSSQ
jgi:hypothetical protein